MLGKTVVNIELKIMKDQPLPAITICIPHFLSITKLTNSSRKNENFQNIFDAYMNLVNQTQNANETSWKSLKSNLNDFQLVSFAF